MRGKLCNSNGVINVGDEYVFHVHDGGGDRLMDESMDWDLSGHFNLFVDGELVRGNSDGTNFDFMDTVAIDTSGASKKRSKTSKKSKALLKQPKPRHQKLTKQQVPRKIEEQFQELEYYSRDDGFSSELKYFFNYTYD